MLNGLWLFYHFCHIFYEHWLSLAVLRYLLKMFYQKLNIQDRTRKSKSMFSLINLSRVSFSCLTFLHLKVFYYLCCFIVNVFKMKIIFVYHQFLNLKDIKVLFTLLKKMFLIKDFLSKCDQIHSFLRYLTIFTEVFFNGKLHFLCNFIYPLSSYNRILYHQNILQTITINNNI